MSDERIDSSDTYFSIDEDNEIMDMFLNLPPLTEMHNPIDMRNIRNHQQQDQEMLAFHHNNPIQFPIKHINGVDIVTM